ncbi:MAG: hypothetical protein NVS1B11_20460 [Terriglobales bacterium]
MRVAATNPQPGSRIPPNQSGSGKAVRPSKRPILTLESIGLLVIAVLALAFILARYWNHIAWSAR